MSELTVDRNEKLALLIHDGENILVDVCDGAVVFGDAYDPDRAAEVLWRSVAGFLFGLLDPAVPLLTVDHDERGVAVFANGCVCLVGSWDQEAAEFWAVMADRIPEGLS